MGQNLSSETDSHTDVQIIVQKLKYVVVFSFNPYPANVENWVSS